MDRFLSKRGSNRAPSFIRQLTKFITVPGMLNMGGGLPNAGLSPLQKLTFTLDNGRTFEFEGEYLNKMLLYSPTLGKPELLEWIRNFMQNQHGRDYERENLLTCVTSGSQDALQRAFDLILDEGDSLLVEQYTYCGALAALKPLSVNLIELPIDENGIIPSEMDRILSTWDETKKFPKALYVIPTGQNPTGVTIPDERRQQIFEIARTYDILILEDDPYFWLQLPDSKYRDVRSFFSMDRQVGGQRVIRFDSFSKTFCAGLRVGWVSGPNELVQRIGYDLEAGAQSASTLPQIMIYNTLTSLGPDNWKLHIDKIQRFYQEQRDVTLRAAEEHLSGLAEWNIPSASMFLWIKVLGVEDTAELVEREAINSLVLFVSGSAFMPQSISDDKKPKSCYLRASYSQCTHEQLEEGIRRLGEVLRKIKSQST